jgi:serine/threonine protein kinase
VEEYQALLRAGTAPDRDEFLARHPGAPAVLGECLAALEMLRDALPEIQASGTDLPSAPAIEPEAPLGDFRILREIGRGGMGVVYEAMQVSLGRRVALKVLPFASALDPRRLQRFRTEAQAAARLHHTNIVPVHAVGCERGLHYYAMQLIEGQTLAAVVADRRRSQGLEAPAQAAAAQASTRSVGFLTEGSIGSAGFIRTVARLGLQAAEALDYAHRQEVIHRDIKPTNLLVDGQGNLWITDFGLARLLGDDGLTMTGDLVGTLRYMSPEQAFGKPALVDHRTDIYSLGVTLYELLTLEPAVPGEERQGVSRRIEREEPRRLRRLNRAVPVELETVIHKAMARDPDARYATAQELADDLRRFLEDKPVRARRPSVRQVVFRWARRHRAVVTTAVLAILVGLIAGIAGLALSNWRIRQEQERTEAARQRAERNLALAMQALDHIYVRVAGDRLAQDPRWQRENRDLLTLVMEFYREVARENNADPLVHLTAARACYRVGGIQSCLGRYEEAREAYDRGLALSEQLAAENPTGPEGPLALAEGHQGVAELLKRTGDHEGAAARHQQALDLSARLVANLPAHPAARKQLADSHNNLGILLVEEGDLRTAEDHYREAMPLLTRLTADFPTQAGYQESLAALHNNLANLFIETGKRSSAETHYRQALQILTRLAADHPQTTPFRQGEARLERNLAAVMEDRDPQAAREHYRQALTRWAVLVAEFPAIPEYRQQLAAVHTDLAILLAKGGERTKAAGHFHQAFDLLTRLAVEFPAVSGYRHQLARVYTNLGHLLQLTGSSEAAKELSTRAVDNLERIAGAGAGLPEQRLDLASAHHHLGEQMEDAGEWTKAEQHYRRAVDLLTRLVEEVPTLSRYRHHLAMNQESLGNLLYARGEQAAGTKHFREALALRTRISSDPLAGGAGTEGQADNLRRLARLLALCPDQRLRNPGRSVRLARQAVAEAPRQGEYWFTLGLAWYRAGDLRAALDALQQGNQLRRGWDPGDGFLMALIHWRLGNKELARQWYQQAARFMADHQPGNELLRRWRGEAAELLGLKERWISNGPPRR